MKTIKENVKNIIEINRSTFITELLKVQSVEEVNNYIKEIKNKYKDATHYCYAYIIDDIRKSSDDGEPGGTAGIPMMEVLLKNNLNNILCVVIRYFGGIKLGSGGLVRAYSKSVVEVLNKSHLLTQVDGYRIEIDVEYEKQKELEHLINDYTFFKEYSEKVKYTIDIDKERLSLLEQKNINYKIIYKTKIER